MSQGDAVERMQYIWRESSRVARVPMVVRMRTLGYFVAMAMAIWYQELA